MLGLWREATPLHRRLQEPLDPLQGVVPAGSSRGGGLGRLQLGSSWGGGGRVGQLRLGSSWEAPVSCVGAPALLGGETAARLLLAEHVFRR